MYISNTFLFISLFVFKEVQFKKQENAFISYCERKLQASQKTSSLVFNPPPPPAKFGFNFAPPFLYLKSTTFPKVGVCFRQTEISIRFHFTQFKLVSRKTLKMIVTVLYGFLFLAVVIFLTNEADKLSQRSFVI